MNSIRLFVTTSQGSSSDHFIVRVFRTITTEDTEEIHTECTEKFSLCAFPL
jgi:hypothetical protein